MATGLAAALMISAPAAADVYWANQSGNSIGRAKLAGTRVNQDFITGAATPRGVAIDRAHVYWAQGDGSGTIGRANLDGTGVNQTFIATGGVPQGVAVDNLRVYWTQTASGSGTVGRASLDGSGANQSFIATGPAPCGVAVAADDVYWANNGEPGSLGHAHIDGSDADQSFLAATRNPCGVAVAGRRVYWANQSGDSIGRANLDGTRVKRRLIHTAGPCGVAVDGAHVYWTTERDTVARANLDGTGVKGRFITGAQDPCGVAVTPNLKVRPRAHRFPKTPVGRRSTIQAFFVANVGSSVLDVSAARLVGRDATDFAKTGDGCTPNVAPPVGGCVLNARFTPTTPGRLRARLRVISNANNSPLDIRLRGVATERGG